MISETTARISSQATLSPVLQAWEIFLTDQGSSPHTITAFLGDLRLLASYLPPDRQVGEISLPDLNNFLRWLENERDVPCSPKTLARRITSLKSFFRWLHEGGAIPSNPAEQVVQKSVRSPLPDILDSDEIDQILDSNRRPIGRKPILICVPICFTASYWRPELKKANAFPSAQITSSWILLKSHWYLSVMLVPRIAIRNERLPYPRTGSMSTMNTGSCTTLMIGFSLGQPGCWNILWRTWERCRHQ